MSRTLLIATAVLCMALMIRGAVPNLLSPVALWGGAAVIAGLAIAASRKMPWLASGGEFLCDSCKLNDSRYCSRRERPNARSCPDYFGG